MMTGKSRALEFRKKLLRLFCSSRVTFTFHRTEPFNKPHDSCRFIYNDVVGNWLSENFFYCHVWSPTISHQKKEARYFHLTTLYDFQHETLMAVLGFPTLERPWEKGDTWIINLDPLFSLTVLFPWELAKHLISQQKSIYIGEQTKQELLIPLEFPHSLFKLMFWSQWSPQYYLCLLKWRLNSTSAILSGPKLPYLFTWSTCWL